MTKITVVDERTGETWTGDADRFLIVAVKDVGEHETLCLKSNLGGNKEGMCELLDDAREMVEENESLVPRLLS